MSDYTEYFLNSKSSVVQLELIEIAHPSFTKTYRIVRNATAGITVTLETSEVAAFDYYPAKIKGLGTRENLDFGLSMELGDLGEIIPKELDEVDADESFQTKPTVVYRTYRSDDLTKPLFGPLVLEITTFNFKREGSSFEAKAPSLNVNTTGELYTFARFPMLRGFL